MGNDFYSMMMAAFATLAPAEQGNHIQTYQLPAIAGLWQVTSLQDAKQSSGDANDTDAHQRKSIHESDCQERYNFGVNGKINTVSGQERTSGEYRFAYVEEVGLPVLAMITNYDNNLPDCSGYQVDQTNNSLAVYVKLDSRHNPKIMQWCEDKEGQTCRITFERVLP